MKNRLAVLLVPAFLIGAPVAASADEGQLSVGVKAWANSWEFSDGTDALASDNSALMVGPSLKYRQGNVFVGASYMVSLTEYEFSDSDIDPGVTADIAAEKNDLDIIVGFMITPRIGVYGGYKTMAVDVSVSNIVGAPASNYGGFSIDYSGFGLGLLGNVPLSERAVLFGSLGVMSLEEDTSNADGSSSVEDLTGSALEIGVSMAMSSSVSASVSIKSQGLTYDDGSDFSFTGLAASIDVAL